MATPKALWYRDVCLQMLDQSIGFIGAGQMARALASGFVSSGLIAAERIAATDPVDEAAAAFQQSVPGSRTLADNASLAGGSDVLLLATKPQQVRGALGDLSDALAGKLLVSIAAGVKLATLDSLAPGARLVRVMPNTPCLVGQSASAYCLGPRATAADGQLVAQLLSAVGLAFAVEEKLLDAVTGLSGSGPAFVYVMIEALADGGVRMGLPRDVAAALAAKPCRRRRDDGDRNGRTSQRLERSRRQPRRHDDRRIAGARIGRAARTVDGRRRGRHPQINRTGSTIIHNLEFTVS